MLISLNSQIDNCQHFYWYEALRLDTWGVYVWPETLAVRDNIIKTARKLELIRSLLGVPMVIESYYRPKLYNQVIKGAKFSAHLEGLACDFRPVGLEIKTATDMIKPHLDEFDIRMESHSGNWIHIDLREPTDNRRYFKP